MQKKKEFLKEIKSATPVNTEMIRKWKTYCWYEASFSGLDRSNQPPHCLKSKPPPEQGSAAAAAAKSLQSCPTLCDPIDSSPPGSTVPGILQARILEWVAMSFSNAWKWKESEIALILFNSVKADGGGEAVEEKSEASRAGSWPLRKEAVSVT